MFGGTARHYSPIAIDIGTANLHAGQLERRGGKLVVHGWSELSLVNKDDVATRGRGDAEKEKSTGGQAAAASATAVQKPGSQNWPVIDASRFQGNEVVVSINPPEVECAPLRVPENLLKLDHRALLSAIRHEVSRTISQPVDQVEMDVWKLQPGHLDSPNLMVAAARRELIAGILAWLDAQKLLCRRIDVGPLAALRACARLKNCPSEDQLWGVLDVGMSSARLYIGVRETPVYVRCIPRGGEEMTRRISEELSVSPSMAEAYKKHYGLSSSGEGNYRANTTAADAVDSRRMAGILLGVLRPTLRSISEEVQRSFRYAMGLYPDRPIAGLWLMGGGAALTGFAEVLHEMLGVEVCRTTSDMLPADWAVPAGWTDDSTVRSLATLGACLGEMN